MSDAPERIWATPSKDGRLNGYCSNALCDEVCAEYIRSDLVDEARTQVTKLVTVKPLVWEDFPSIDGHITSMACSVIGTYFICNDTDDFTGLYLELVTHKDAKWFGSVRAVSVLISENNHIDDLSPLKDMANSHHADRIREALE